MKTLKENERIIEGRKSGGWMILTNRDKIEVDKLIGKIQITITANKYLGRQKLRISKKVLGRVYDLLDNKTQRIRKEIN